MKRRPAVASRAASFGQERIWVLDRLASGSPAYTVWVTLELHGTLDYDALTEALGEVVRRHEVLRTTFGESDGRVIQLVHEPTAVAIELVDAVTVDEARSYIANRLEEPFDLRSGPLFRVVLVRINLRRHLFLAVFHHIVCDGWSRALFVRELCDEYNSLVTGQPMPRRDGHVYRFGAFAEWQRKRVAASDRGDAYWHELLRGRTCAEFPLDHPRPRVPSYRGDVVTFSLSSDTRAAVERLAKATRCSLFMVAVAALASLVHRYARSTDIAIGTSFAGRTRTEFEEMIGFFVNTVPLVVDISGRPTFRELLGRVRNVVLDAYEYQDVPLERMVREAGAERDLSRNPLFQVTLNYHNAPAVAPALHGVQVMPLDVGATGARFDLEMHLRPEDGVIGGALVYSSDILARPTVERLIDQFRAVIAQVVVDPDVQVGRLALIRGEEEQLVVHEWAHPDRETASVDEGRS